MTEEQHNEQIQKLLKQIRPLLPKEWTASESIGLDMLGGSSPEFVHIMGPKLPVDCRYQGSIDTIQARRERRKVWRSKCQIEANKIGALLRDNLTGVRVTVETNTIRVTIN